MRVRLRVGQELTTPDPRGSLIKKLFQGLSKDKTLEPPGTTGVGEELGAKAQEDTGTEPGQSESPVLTQSVRAPSKVLAVPRGSELLQARGQGPGAAVL